MQDQDIVIKAPAIFSFAECLWYLDRNFDDCSHAVEGNSVVKAIRFEGEELLFRLSGGDNFLRVEMLLGTDSAKARKHIEAYIRKWLDLDRDIQPFYDLLARDERVAFMADAFYGLRVVAINELFEALSWSIIGQQINLAFAFRMKRRITERFGTNIEYGDQLYHIFPRAEVLAAIDPEELRPMQFSQRKAEYLVGLAKQFASGALTEEGIAALPDFQSKQETLTKIRGIGVWTANYALMKSMHIPEAVPYGDAGLFIALESLNIIDNRKEAGKIEAFFREFEGWQNYMVYYLWRSRRMS